MANQSESFGKVEKDPRFSWVEYTKPPLQEEGATEEELAILEEEEAERKAEEEAEEMEGMPDTVKYLYENRKAYELKRSDTNETVGGFSYATMRAKNGKRYLYLMDLHLDDTLSNNPKVVRSLTGKLGEILRQYPGHIMRWEWSPHNQDELAERYLSKGAKRIPHPFMASVFAKFFNHISSDFNEFREMPVEDMLKRIEVLKK